LRQTPKNGQNRDCPLPLDIRAEKPSRTLAGGRKRAGHGRNYRQKPMRGEHFLLLAERNQLLAPVVLAQLRRILAQQRRPATGEAVARLLVNRGYLTVEQARGLVALGSGTGSPLVPQMANKTSAEAATGPAISHSSEELLLTAEQSAAEIDSRTKYVVPPPIQQKSAAPGDSSPLIPTEAELANLTDSLRQWIELPGTLDWNAPPSPLFAPPRWYATPAMLLLASGGILVMFILGMLVLLARWSAG
jgi:hypothetical protein